MFVLNGGTLIDGTGNPPVEDAVVIIEDSRIKHAGKREESEIAEGADVTDITGKTILPGLMDLHIHLCLADDDVLAPKAALPTFIDKPAPWLGIRAFSIARRSLKMGFTTLRSCGEIVWLDVNLRSAVDEGIVEGPRIVCSGQFLSTTGGQWDFFPEWLIRTDTENNLADGNDAIIKAVRRQVKMKTDWVKYCATGGIMNAYQKTHNFTPEELKTLVETAHSNGLLVSAHCIHHKGTLDAVKAGTDSIEHGAMLTDEIIDLMLEKGTYLVPTLYAPHAVVHRGIDYGLPEVYIEKAKPVMEVHQRSFEKALKAGVKIACGSDSGMTSVVHGTSAVELEIMVDHGMSPMQAILAATRDSADCLQRKEELGTVEKGKTADLIVVDGNPLDDISVLQKQECIALVMKDGVVQYNNLTG